MAVKRIAMKNLTEAPLKGWTLSEAQDFLSAVKPIFERYGVDLELVGSIESVGSSEHDLDLVMGTPSDDMDGAWFDAVEADLLREFPGAVMEGNMYEPLETLHLPDGRIVDFFYGED